MGKTIEVHPPPLPADILPETIKILLENSVRDYLARCGEPDRRQR